MKTNDLHSFLQNHYKLSYFLVFSSLSFVSCKSQSIEYVYEDRSIILNEMEKRFDVKERLNIFFESGFKDENVRILIDSKEKYNDNITTDNTIGLAKNYSFNELPKKDLKINLPELVINFQVEKLKDYKYIYIQKKEKKYFVLISNKPHFYY